MYFSMGWRAGLTVLVLTLTPTARAQAELQHRTYSKTELTSMQGQSVLDIVEQIPGFQFVDSNTERGLSNAVGNVLIDGLPILNKSQSLEDVLADLPISQVQSLTVYLAGHAFAGASQHTQVINIIRDESEQPINWRAAALSQDGQLTLSDLSLQRAITWHGWEHQLQLGKDASHWGSRTKSGEYFPDGEGCFATSENYLERSRTKLAGLISTKRFSHGTVQVNAQWRLMHDNTSYDRDEQDWLLQEQSRTIIDDRTTAKSRSIGVDWLQSQTVSNDWQWHITWLLRDEHNRDTSATDQALTFDQARTLRERVVKLARQNQRSTYVPEYGLEYSYNTLSALTRQQSNSIAASVSESRYEPYVAMRLNLNADWQLYSKLIAEFSTLESQSSTTFEASNQYLKPLIRLTYQAPQGFTSTFGIQRRIEQLNFDDFVPSLDNDFSRAQSGNSSLAPEQSWELSYEFNYSHLDFWAVNSKLFWQRQQDIHEYVKLADNEWGIGNAGDANEYGMDVDVNIKTDGLLAGSQINALYQYRDAKFDDPLSGPRITSWLVPHTGELEFRQDGEHFAWGVVAKFGFHKWAFYPDETYYQREKTWFDAYVEWSITDTLQLELEVEHLSGGRVTYDRDIFTLTRGGELDYRYLGVEHYEPSVSLSLSGQF